MNFEYYPVRKSVSSLLDHSVMKRVSLLKLAVNVVTDWMPGIPASMSRGFVDLLSRVIEQQQLSTAKHFNKKMWILQSDVVSFEKQWRMSTAWMLGIAFCRKVVEMEGYPWWAPVSAFTSSTNKVKVGLHQWAMRFPTSTCHIERVKSKCMLPDYVLACIDKTSGRYQVAFAESKGIDAALDNKSQPQIDWLQQSRNAAFYDGGTKLLPKQNLIVATRVSPGMIKPKTRRVMVRAWNSENLEASASFNAFRTILAMHYFGVCRQLSLNRNADLIAVTSEIKEIEARLENINSNALGESKLHRQLSELREAQLSLVGQARQEVPFYDAVGNRLRIRLNPSTSSYAINGRTIRIGFSESGYNVVEWLQGQQIDLDEALAAVHNESSEDAEGTSSQNTALRNDGVFGILDNG